MSRIDAESNGVNSIFANMGNWGEILEHLIVSSSSSHSFNKTDFEQYFFHFFSFQLSVVLNSVLDLLC